MSIVTNFLLLLGRKYFHLLLSAFNRKKATKAVLDSKVFQNDWSDACFSVRLHERACCFACLLKCLSRSWILIELLCSVVLKLPSESLLLLWRFSSMCPGRDQLYQRAHVVVWCHICSGRLGTYCAVTKK